MNEKSKVRFQWLEKIKNVKHIEIIVIAIFLVVLLLIYFSTPRSKSNSNATIKENTELTITRYIDNLEADLENTISKIRGVGNVNVLITLNLDNASIENDVIKTATFPKIKGIVIVASGVDNTSVKMNILRALIRSYYHMAEAVVPMYTSYTIC